MGVKKKASQITLGKVKKLHKPKPSAFQKPKAYECEICGDFFDHADDVTMCPDCNRVVCIFGCTKNETCLDCGGFFSGPAA